MLEKSNSNSGSLTYYLDEPFFKMRISVRFTNMNSFICKGISSSGNPFCSLSKDVKKTIQIDLNPLMNKEFSLDNVIFLNKFEQRLVVRRMKSFYEKLVTHSHTIFRKNNIDGIDCYEVIESEINKEKVFDNIILASGKNIEFIPVTDRTKDDVPFCGVMMAINYRVKYLVMTPDEFEYFIDLLASIDIEKCFNDAITMMYLAELNKSGKTINRKSTSSPTQKTLQRTKEVDCINNYKEVKPLVPKMPVF